MLRYQAFEVFIFTKQVIIHQLPLHFDRTGQQVNRHPLHPAQTTVILALDAYKQNHGFCFTSCPRLLIVFRFNRFELCGASYSLHYVGICLVEESSGKLCKEENGKKSRCTFVHLASPKPHNVSSLLRKSIRIPTLATQIHPQIHAVLPLQRAYIFAEPGRLPMVG